jgi:N-acetylglutamate synthase-like GNAT family acetyltransferase
VQRTLHGGSLLFHEGIKYDQNLCIDLSKFFIAVQGEKIIGSCALLRNVLISWQDLVPWFGCLFISPEARGNNTGAVMLQHALEQTRLKGYERLYLSTTLVNYYEKYGWQYFAEGYYLNGDATKIYSRLT